MRDILVRPLASTDIAEVVKLLIAQTNRFSHLDSRLEPSLSPEQIIASLKKQCDETHISSFVAQDQDSRIRGYAQPSLYQLSSESALLVCYTSRNGTFQQLALPEPTAADALAVTSALLSALSRWWQEQEALADLFYWPSCEPWFEALLLEQGFLADSILAHRSLQPLPLSHRPATSRFSTRLARPEDEEVLVELHLAEVAFHLPYTPFYHMVPAVETGFRESLGLLWEGKSLEEGAPLVLVVEYEGKVVAMAESYLQQVTQESPRRRLPPGRYGYLNSVCVREEMRGKGIGRVLIRAVFDAFAPFALDGYTLWFSRANPLSGPFWSHLGFLPLWTRYTRLRVEQN